MSNNFENKGYALMDAPPQVQVVAQPFVVSDMYAPAFPQSVAVGPSETNMLCPNCRQQVKTATIKEYQKSAHICALFCCIFGCWLCCWFPYCMSSFKNVLHKCPNCSAFLGTYKG